MMGFRTGFTLGTWRHYIVASVVRELQARYARSLMGWIWLLLPPLVLIGIYTFVFSRIMGLGALPDRGPYGYSLFLCAGLLTWQWFSELLSRVLNIFGHHATVLKKTAIPWPVLLASDILVITFGLAVQLGLYFALLYALGAWPGISLLNWIPALAAMGLLAVGLGLGLAVMNVFFRDVGMGVGLLLQIWFWLTPIVYPLSALPTGFGQLANLNPVTPLITVFQNAVVYPEHRQPWAAVLTVGLLAVAALWLSLRLVRRNLKILLDQI